MTKEHTRSEYGPGLVDGRGRGGHSIRVVSLSNPCNIVNPKSLSQKRHR